MLVIVAYAGPTMWLIATSLKEEGRIFTPVPHWIPEPITFANYAYVFESYPLGRWFWNSTVVSLATVLLCLLINIPAGYAFARYRFRGDRLLFWLTLVSVMVPVQAYLVPMYLIFAQLKLLNTLTGLILPFLSNGFGVFLIRQFVQQIPPELEEAAIIDGASQLRILWRIVVPLTTPAIATLIIFRFMHSWNSFAWPLVAASSDQSITLPVGLALHVFGVVGAASAQPRYGLSMAASFVSVLPAIIVFLSMQRYFVEGVASSGFK
jgi:multiple sugar transport system permease protein